MSSTFDVPRGWRPRALARNDHPGTSHAAAAAIAPVTGKIRREVYAYAVQRGPDGFIDEELFGQFPGKAQNSIRPRRIELVQDGLLVDTGKRRLNPRGRECVVWAVRIVQRVATD